MPPELLNTGLLGVFAVLVLIAALKDLSSFTIPNWIPAALAVAFVPVALLAGAGWIQIGVSVLVGLALLVAGIVMFALKWLGGGDAKLLAAASLWLGLPGLPPFLLYTGVAGGVLALSLLGLRSAWVRPFAMGGPRWVDRLATPGAATPYGVAIAAGALAAFPHGLLMQAATGGL